MRYGKFAVIGLGTFGMSIAKELARRGAEVLAIDNDPLHIEIIKDEVAYAVVLDATDRKALLSQNIQDMDTVVVAMGENFEALILTVVHLLELGVKKVMARANGAQQRLILEKMGVHEILSPELEVGRIVAERLMNPSLVSFIPLPDGYEIAEIKTPPEIANRTLADINLRSKYKLNLITIKRAFEKNVNGEVITEEHIIGVPGSDTVIFDSDTIIVFGTNKDIQRFIDINQ
ncbi:MAG: TrkA family potassium uptake protein [Flavobacteriales bacterium]|nr:TrkA family potassium uptake protein [Flavobacteriales bacterium]MDW8431283.1 TrkA family potassium uptake protein [Flavobacteriales bacterium]